MFGMGMPSDQHADLGWRGQDRDAHDIVRQRDDLATHGGAFEEQVGRSECVEKSKSLGSAS